jgi:hypothetical protein
MVIGRTDEQQNPRATTAITCRLIVWMLFAEPIWACGHGAALERGRTHDRVRTHTKFCFNYLTPAGRPHMSRDIATILEQKFSQHLPLNRLNERFAQEGIKIDTFTLADWVGACTAALAPLSLGIGQDGTSAAIGALFLRSLKLGGGTQPPIVNFAADLFADPGTCFS